MGKAIGIDFGTTNSCAAIWDGNEPVMIVNEEGDSTIPSVVSITKDGERIAGKQAKLQMYQNADRTVLSIKRKLGTVYHKDIDGKKYTAQEITAIILRKIKKEAERVLNEDVNQAVLTVPAYFTDIQRQALREAARIAGFDVMRMMNEPTAAAFAYGLEHGEEQKIFVFDMGGGTFDISIIDISNEMIEVLSTAGDNQLGGDDFDQRVIDYILEEIRFNTGSRLVRNANVMKRLKIEAEKIKIHLSTFEEANVDIDGLLLINHQEYHLQSILSREKFNQMTFDLVDRITAPILHVLKDAGVSQKDINKLILVGESTKIPSVKDKIERMLGIKAEKGVRPNESVALGAAIQAGRLSGQLQEDSIARRMILVDVIPLSLSIETVGGVATCLIPKNTLIPVKKQMIFTTARNNQSSVNIRVYQGDRPFVKDNTLLGEFKLTGIKKAKAGIPQIEVQFDINVDGMLKVSARDMETKKYHEITVLSKSSLSEAKIEKAIIEDRRLEDEFQQKKYYLNLQEECHILITQVESLLNMQCGDLSQKEILEQKQELLAFKKLVAKMKPLKMNRVDADKIIREKKKIEKSVARLY